MFSPYKKIIIISLVLTALIVFFILMKPLFNPKIYNEKKVVSKYEKQLKKYSGIIRNSTENTVFINISTKIKNNKFDVLKAIRPNSEFKIKLFEGSHFFVIENVEGKLLTLEAKGDLLSKPKDYSKFDFPFLYVDALFSIYIKPKTWKLEIKEQYISAE